MKYSNSKSCYVVEKVSKNSGKMDIESVAFSHYRTVPRTGSTIAQSQTVFFLVGEVVIGLRLGKTLSCASRFGTHKPQPLR